MSDLINKEYLSKQFAGYSVVVKEQLDKKVNIDQGVENKGKLLGVNETGSVDLVDAPDNVKISEVEGNQIEEKQDGIYVKDMSAKISSETDNALVEKQDGLYVPSVSGTKVSAETDNQIVSKEDGIYVAPTDLTNYVEKADGKGLSTNDLTDELVEKIENTYTKTEVDDAITNAQLGGEEVDLTGYVKQTDLETQLESYTTDEELSTTLADYSTTAESDEKYVLDEEITVLSESDVLALLNLSDEELTNLASLIDDVQISLTKVWSSSKVYLELANTLDSAKAYTLSELSKSIGASYKVVTSVDQMTSDKVLYLLKDANSGIYNIYIYDTDTSTTELIGSFEVSLDDYMTRTELTDTFTKQTDFEPVSTQVTAIMDGTTSVPKADEATNAETLGGLSADTFATKEELANAIADVEVEISADENNQLENRENGLYVGKVYKEVTQAEYDLIENKDSDNILYFITDAEPTNSTGSNIEIVTTLDSSSTDDTVPSSKVVYDELQNIENGTTVVGNADMIDGLHCYEFRPIDSTSGKEFSDMKATLEWDVNRMVWKVKNTSGTLYKTKVDDSDMVDGKHASDFLSVDGGIINNQIDILQDGDETLPRTLLITTNGGCSYFVNKNVDDTVRRQLSILPVENRADVNESLVYETNESGEWVGHIVVHSGNVADYACTTTVADVDRTVIAFADTTNYESEIDVSAYVIEHGICYVNLYLKVSSVSDTNVVVGTLPIPKLQAYYGHLLPWGISTNSDKVEITINTNGQLCLRYGTNGMYYALGFSYPVAEN